MLLIEFTNTNSQRSSEIVLLNVHNVNAPVLVHSFTIWPVVESWYIDTLNNLVYISETNGFIY